MGVGAAVGASVGDGVSVGPGGAVAVGAGVGAEVPVEHAARTSAMTTKRAGSLRSNVGERDKPTPFKTPS